MATNIAVTLEIDGRKYVAELNRAQTATKQFAAAAQTDVAAAGASFDRLGASTGVLAQRLGKLRSVLAGAAFIGLARSSVQLADQLQDLSEITGLSTQKLIDFRAALLSSGGSADDAGKAITAFFRNVDAAAQGSGELQQAFARVGITLQDLATLDEQQLLTRTLEALSQMPAGAERTALAAQLMGKAFREINLNPAFIETLKNGSAESQALALQIQRAAELNDQWSKTWDDLRLAFIEAFGPILKGIADLIKEMPSLITLMKALGVVIVGVFAATGLRTFISLLGMAARGVGAIVDGFSKIRAAGGIFKSLAGPSRAGGISQARDVASAVGMGAGVAGGAALLFGSEDQTKAAAAATASADTQKRATREVIDALAQQRKAILDIVDAYGRSQEASIRKIQQDAALVSMSDDLAEAYRAVWRIQEEADQAIARLDEKRSEKNKELNAEIDQQIAKIRERTAADQEAAYAAIRSAQEQKRAIENITRSLQDRFDIEQKTKDVQDRYLLEGLVGIERQLKEIELAERKVAEAAMLRAQIQAMKMPEPDALRYLDEERKRIQENFEQSMRQQQRAAREGYQASRSFSAGWNRAFREYVDNATNAAKRAEALFRKFTQGIEDLLVNFAKTGKFEWRQFVADMAEELLRSQIRELMAQIFTLPGFGGLGDIFGGLFGGGQGSSRGQTPTTPLYVMDVSGGGGGGIFGGGTGIFGGNNNGVLTPGGGIGGGSNIITDVIGGIKNIGTGIYEGVKNIGGSIFDGISNIFGGGGGGFGTGDLFDNMDFGGFFANGGTLGAGRWGIAGERGPEMISGPATVTPIMPTQVTYNINAVDAASFKALVAADPGFIYAVTQVGAKSIPGAR